MAKFSTDKDDAPPEWLRRHMGKVWRAWTMARWYEVLVKEGMIRASGGKGQTQPVQTR